MGLPKPIWQWRQLEDGESHNVGSCFHAIDEIWKYQLKEQQELRKQLLQEGDSERVIAVEANINRLKRLIIFDSKQGEPLRTRGVYADGKRKRPFSVKRKSQTVFLELYPSDTLEMKDPYWNPNVIIDEKGTPHFRTNIKTVVGPHRVLVDLPDWDSMRPYVRRYEKYWKDKYKKYLAKQK